MAAFSGKGGAVTVAGVTMVAKHWNLVQNNAVLNTTNFGSSGWKTCVAGIQSFSVSVDGFVDGTTQPTKPTAPGTFALTDGATNTFEGTILVSSLTIDDDVEGLVTFSLSGEGSGALTVT